MSLLNFVHLSLQLVSMKKLLELIVGSVCIDVAESQKVKILATYLRWNEPGFLKPRLNFRLVL